MLSMRKSRILACVLAMVGAIALVLSQAGVTLADPPPGKGRPAWLEVDRGSEITAERTHGGPPSWAGIGRGAASTSVERAHGGPPPWAGVGRGKGNGVANALAGKGPHGTISQQFFESKQACMDAFFDALADFHSERRTILQEIRQAALSTESDREAAVASLRAALAAAEAEKDAAETAKNTCIQEAEAAKDAALAGLEK